MTSVSNAIPPTTSRGAKITGRGSRISLTGGGIEDATTPKSYRSDSSSASMRTSQLLFQSLRGGSCRDGHSSNIFSFEDSDSSDNEDLQLQQDEQTPHSGRRGRLHQRPLRLPDLPHMASSPTLRA
ncbi:unnamed protein product, partial [Amoebophrya sp. A25]|eukprot:GSA25T00001266001.1